MRWRGGLAGLELDGRSRLAFGHESIAVAVPLSSCTHDAAPRQIQSRRNVSRPMT